MFNLIYPKGIKTFHMNDWDSISLQKLEIDPTPNTTNRKRYKDLVWSADYRSVWQNAADEEDGRVDDEE